MSVENKVIHDNNVSSYIKTTKEILRCLFYLVIITAYTLVLIGIAGFPTILACKYSNGLYMLIYVSFIFIWPVWVKLGMVWRLINNKLCQ